MSVTDYLACADPETRAAALELRPDLNGIEYVEAPLLDQTKLDVSFYNDLPSDAYGLVDQPERITIEGGRRIVDIRVREVTPVDSRRLELRLSGSGDFSRYTLRIDAAELDPLLSSASFSFKAACPVDVDCMPATVQEPGTFPEPALDYLAKDYSSFRRLLVDLLPQLNPSFAERNPSDLGVALVELFAYVGDHLSYAQDAVAAEAFLETARHRISARRHARLVDYRVQDGRNAWVAVHVEAAQAATLPVGTKVVTRIGTRLAGDDRPPETVISAVRLAPEAFERDAALSGAAVFETAHSLDADPLANTIFIHAWGGDECALPRGATGAFLYSVDTDGHAQRPALEVGSLLVLEERVSPATGQPGDADRARRQLVTLEFVGGQDEFDPLFTDEVSADGTLQAQEKIPTDPTAVSLPLLHVRWRREDALPFALCLATKDAQGRQLRDVSVARGNIVLADHGLTVRETRAPGTPATPTPGQRTVFSNEPTTANEARTRYQIDDPEKRVWEPGSQAAVERSADGGATWAPVDPDEFTVAGDSGTIVFLSAQAVGTRIRVGGVALPPPLPAEPSFRLALDRGPLTMQCGDFVRVTNGVSGPPVERDGPLDCAVEDARPAVALLVSFSSAPTEPELWQPAPDLLESTPFDRAFVAEIDNDGRPILRFGDGEHGREIAGATAFEARYRIGNGIAGNVGLEALAHVALEDPAQGSWIRRVRNPLPARGGVEPETLEEIRQRAPQEFRTKQIRAVTEDDYANAARRAAGVASAVARFRWNGSWYEVVVAVDPVERGDVSSDRLGRPQLSSELDVRVQRELSRARLAGYDVRVLPPRFVPLELAIDVCVSGDHYRGEVAAAVRAALGPALLPEGGAGLFHPSNWSFGQSVYVSRIYAAVTRIEGVDSALVTRLRRYGEPDRGELESGVLSVGSDEVAQLENDPNFLEHGLLSVRALGGKA